MDRPTDSYDTVIIGAGQAAVPLANTLAQHERVALVERQHLGGSCVNFGCTPTKAVLASAQVAHLARHAADYGIKVGPVEVDFAAVLARAKALVEESRSSLRGSFESDNPTLITGHARLGGKDGEYFRVQVGEKLLLATRVVLDTGTRTLLPPIDGLDDVDIITAANWLEVDTLPEHLVIVGGSYIGLEMSQFYRRMGARVTVIERGAQIAAKEDEDVARTLQTLLEGEGIEVILNVSVSRVSRTDARVTVTLDDDRTLEASHLFVASGRKPNTDDLGLDTVGVALDEKGFVKADARLATSAENIWVAGDIRGGPMFTHTSYDDYRVLASQLVGDGTRTTERIVPYAVFTEPQLGRVGVSEREAREAGRAIKVATFDMKKNGRAREAGQRGGFIKVVVDAHSDRILGAAVLSAEGAEVVHSYIALMNADAPYTAFWNAVPIHPTYAEGAQSVLGELE